MPDFSAEVDLPTRNPGIFTGLTVEVVTSDVSRNFLPSAELLGFIATLHGALQSLGEPRSGVARKPTKPTPPVSIRKSVTDTHLVSLKDARIYKTLKRHLRKLDLTSDSYRAKWGLPASYPMTSPAFSRARSAQAKEMSLGALGRKR